MSVEVSVLTGCFAVEDCSDALVGCNKDGAMGLVPFVCRLLGCCVDGGGGNAKEPMLPSPERLPKG